MSLEQLLIFIPACFALNMAPGPNNLLSVSNATRYGFSTACMAGIGRIFAFIGMITIAASGLAVVLQTSALAFTLIKIVGALYLFYLAIQLWRAPPQEAPHQGNGHRSGSISLWRLSRQEFMVAAGNPKAILIFTAFLPQFVDPAQASTPQFTLLGSLFLVLEWVAIAAYACMGSHLSKWFSAPAKKRLFNRVSGTLLGLAGCGLLLSRKTS